MNGWVNGLNICNFIGIFQDMILWYYTHVGQYCVLYSFGS